MKLKTIFILFILLFSNHIFGQKSENYKGFVTQAENFYKKEQYKESANRYEEAFKTLNGKAYSTDRYNAACSYALANDKKKSFYHLFYLAENPKVRYRNLNHITTDTDLMTLHSSEEWNRLINIIEANKLEYEKDFDKDLVSKLDSIYDLDQGYRKQIGEIEKKYGRESMELKTHWKLINKTDSVNLIKIKTILDNRGWLSSNVIGNKGNNTLFLVIQHSDLETQVEYLPMMREAVKLGNANSSSLALLEDRVALRKGGKQIYGSQISRDVETGEYYVSPLIEPENINERRAAVGLGSIEDYIKHWNMTWDIEKHKNRIKKLESDTNK